jgi:hypothetical protein
VANNRSLAIPVARVARIFISKRYHACLLAKLWKFPVQRVLRHGICCTVKHSIHLPTHPKTLSLDSGANGPPTIQHSAMNTFLPSSELNPDTLAQGAFLAAFNVGPNGGTILVLAVALAVGYVTGLCIWREDRQRFHEAEKVNAGLQAQIDEARNARS